MVHCLYSDVFHLSISEAVKLITIQSDPTKHVLRRSGNILGADDAEAFGNFQEEPRAGRVGCIQYFSALIVAYHLPKSISMTCLRF